MKSKILVFIQFATIFLMLLPIGTKTSNFYVGITLLVIGLIIGIAAIYKNRFGNFNIRPDIKEDCKLITDGIYAYVRHPMYTSVLVAMFGIMLLYINIFEIILYTILLINMLIKMFYEEKLWNCNGENYREYAQKTSRLIPFLF